MSDSGKGRYVPKHSAKAKRGRQPSQGTQVQHPSGDEPIVVVGSAGNFMAGETTKRNYSARKRIVWILAGATVLVTLFCLVVPSSILQVPFGQTPFAEFLHQMMNRVEALFAVLTGQSGGFYSMLFVRVIVVAFAGAALGMCGAVYQGALGNGLASPNTLGVSSGASLGAVIFVMFLAPTIWDGETILMSELMDRLDALSPLEFLWYVYGRAFCAILLSFGVIVLIMWLAGRVGKGRNASIVLIVCGTVISTLFSSVLSLFSYYLKATGDVGGLETLASATPSLFGYIQTGTDMVLVCAPLLVIMAIVLVLRARMGLLTLDEGEALSLGINVKRMRWAVMLLCTAMTAIVIAYCGSIGLIGFLVPHMARRLVGSDFRFLLPASMFLGAVLLLVCNFLCGIFIVGYVAEPLSLATSVFGCIAFIVIAFGKRGDARGTWG